MRPRPANPSPEPFAFTVAQILPLWGRAPTSTHPKDRTMTWITTLDDLHGHYDTPGKPATVKVTPYLTSAYRTWLTRARFCILTEPDPAGAITKLNVLMNESGIGLPWYFWSSGFDSNSSNWLGPPAMNR